MGGLCAREEPCTGGFSWLAQHVMRALLGAGGALVCDGLWRFLGMSQHSQLRAGPGERGLVLQGQRGAMLLSKGSCSSFPSANSSGCQGCWRVSGQCWTRHDSCVAASPARTGMWLIGAAVEAIEFIWEQATHLCRCICRCPVFTEWAIVSCINCACRCCIG